MDALKKWMIIRFKRYQTTPNLHPAKIDVNPKTFIQIILAAKWLMVNSSTYPNQQRRPLPSLLYLSFFCMRGANALYSLGYMVSELVMGLNILAQWAFTAAFLGTIQFRLGR